MKRTPSPLARMRRLYDPHALCHHLARILLEEGQECDHTFALVRAFFQQYAPAVDVEAYIVLLREAGANCSCEVGYNVCGRLSGA